MDPLSIAAGVTSLIGVCAKVGLALNDVRDGANLANAKVDVLRHEIKGFTQVLELTKSTMEGADVQVAFQSTGHIGNHWRSIAAGIKDSRQTLERLHSIVEGFHKTVRVLDGTRKHFRLRLAASEITIYQQKIRTYRNTMQMSIQTVILWNQVSHQESTDKILPGLDDLTGAIHRLALDMNAQIASLRSVVESGQSQDQLQSLGHMKKCLETAADVISSASTTLGLSDRASVIAPSDFDDIFGSRSNEAVMRWIYASEEPGGDPPPSTASTSTSMDTPRSSKPKLDDSDSDFGWKWKPATPRQRYNTSKAACLGCAKTDIASKTRSARWIFSPIWWWHIIPLTRHLAWLESKELAMEQLRIVSKWEPSPSTTFIYLEKGYQLAMSLLQLDDTTQAEVYAKKCIKGYKKMRNEVHNSHKANCLPNSLELMVNICEANGDEEGAQAYRLLCLETRETLVDEESSLPHQLNEPNDPATNTESSDPPAPAFPSMDHTGFSSTSEQPVTRSREATVPSPRPGLATPESGQIRKTAAVNVLLLPAARRRGDFIARSLGPWDAARWEQHDYAEGKRLTTRTFRDKTPVFINLWDVNIFRWDGLNVDGTRRPGPAAPALEALGHAGRRYVLSWDICQKTNVRRSIP
ncbi:hypothetical protein B0H66DRAFT_626328 [Apodospora peruviana]|uniref:Fungal N-terminal domain-containing protein n=1 Tax=Apodospora peruviana TaxID=516989 RepID=A0AAE0I1E6_9PEZI|nr:hypothetical protein B0H66DRAFT_626328 [Apodospora peruviana]